MGDSLSFDRIAERYDATRGGEDRGERFARELLPMLDPNEPVVEIGVGTGLIAAALQRSGFRVLGIDLSVAMLRRAGERVGPSVAAGDALRLPFADSSVPQAFSVWLLHVVGDILGALREAGRVLRSGGHYLVVPGFTDRPGDPIGQAVLELQLRVDPEGVRRDHPPALERLAPRAGLRLVEVRPLAEHDYLESPQTAIDKLESRSYSILWTLPDDAWESAIRPTVAALRALPDPDVPIRRRSSGFLAVLERP